MMIVERDTNLFKVILAAAASGRFARRLDGRQQESHQDADNRNDD
jgi:hypothetical protein